MAGRVDGNTFGNKQIGSYLSSTSNRDMQLRRDYFRLRILYDRVLYQLRPPMILYNEGEFEYFMNSMPNLLTYTRLLNNDNTFFYNQETALDSYEYDANLVEKYRYVTNRIIDTIKQAMTEYIKIQNLEKENADLKSYKDILEDRENLIAYLETQKHESHLFSASATLQVQYELKLWYQVYLERHGPPGDGVFNSELLAEIIEELVASGEVTEDELIF